LKEKYYFTLNNKYKNLNDLKGKDFNYTSIFIFIFTKLIKHTNEHIKKKSWPIRVNNKSEEIFTEDKPRLKNGTIKNSSEEAENNVSNINFNI
jgi:hypothetical protein